MVGSAEGWDDVSRQIERAIPGVVVEDLGGACPLQGNGYIRSGIYGGFRWYFRFRHDEACLYIYVAAKEKDPQWGYTNYYAGTLYYSEIIGLVGDQHAGTLSYDETLALFVLLWQSLRPKDQWESTGIERLYLNVEELGAQLRRGELKVVTRRGDGQIEDV